MTTLDRFQKSRWSRTRQRMHAMRPGQVLRLPRSQYFNAHASAYRLTDAYEGRRKWTLTRNGKTMTVRVENFQEQHEYKIKPKGKPMKTKIYLRIAKGKKGIRADASAKPNYEPLRNSKTYRTDSENAIPTLAFAVEFDIPDDLFKQAEQVAATINLAKEKATICGKVVQA